MKVDLRDYYSFVYDLRNISPKYLTKNPLKKKIIERFLSKIVTIAQQSNPQSILDAGCGSGVPLFYLSRYLPRTRMVGFDISRKEIQIAKEVNKGVDFILATVEAPPFREETFDLVLCLEVLEHLKNPAKALSSLRKAGKKIVCSTPDFLVFSIANLLSMRNIRNLGEDEEHLHKFSKASFARFLMKEFWHFEITRAPPWLIATLSSKSKGRKAHLSIPKVPPSSGTKPKETPKSSNPTESSG